MLDIILKGLYIMLPGIGANMTPVFVKGVFKKLAVPVDFGKKINGKPIFGANKTYRGIIFGVLVAILIAYAQYILYSYGFFRKFSLLDYSNWPAVGFLVGFGVMSGDLANSFFKRRLGIKPGRPFFPFDQLNAAIGGIIFISFVYTPPFGVITAVIISSFVMSLIINLLGYYLGLREIKW